MLANKESQSRNSAGSNTCESPHYIGRAICSLANDPDIHRKTGQILRVGDLAVQYGFTNLDGRIIQPFYL